MAAFDLHRDRTQFSPTGGQKIADPIPFSIAIPGSFTTGTTAGNVTAIDAYTARITLSPPLQLASSMEAHVVTAALSYTQPNMGAAADIVPGFPAGDNRISITWNGGARTDYLLAKGLYGYPDVAQALNLIAFNAGWITSLSPPLFTLVGVSATQKVILSVNPAGLSGGVFPAGGVVIDFLNPGALALNDSMGPILGFPTSGGGATLTIAGGGSATVTFPAPNVANFAIYSAYILYLSCVRDGYLNGLSGKILYSFPLGDFAPNSVVAYQPPLILPVPVVSGTYSQVDIYFTDQSGNRLSLANFQAPTSLSIMMAKTRFDGSV